MEWALETGLVGEWRRRGDATGVRHSPTLSVGCLPVLPPLPSPPPREGTAVISLTDEET